MTGPSFDPYRVLGVSRSATAAEVARAYRRRAKEIHPDLHGSDGVRAMQQLNLAFRTLSDPERRVAWDAAHPLLRRDHWVTASQAAQPGSATSPGPAAWAAWEAHPAAARPEPQRIRSAGAWPRDSSPSLTPSSGIRDSAWLAVGVALSIVVGALILGWIASTNALATSSRDAINRVGVTPVGGYMLDPDHEVGVFLRTGGIIGLVAAERDESGWSARVLVEATSTHPLSVLLYVDDASGDAGLPSIAFGRAQGGVAEVRVRGSGGQGAAVVQGTWSMPVPGVTDPGQLEWEFVLVDGTVVRGGGALDA